jgi:hypothetical protein
MSDRIWTDEQVAMLNERQKRGDMHPYTCPGERKECESRRNLIATPQGWTCACGQYRQGWAHETKTT